jgi:hypothetical protein
MQTLTPAPPPALPRASLGDSRPGSRTEVTHPATEVMPAGEGHARLASMLSVYQTTQEHTLSAHVAVELSNTPAPAVVAVVDSDEHAAASGVDQATHTEHDRSGPSASSLPVNSDASVPAPQQHEPDPAASAAVAPVEEVPLQMHEPQPSAQVQSADHSVPVEMQAQTSGPQIAPLLVAAAARAEAALVPPEESRPLASADNSVRTGDTRSDHQPPAVPLQSHEEDHTQLESVNRTASQPLVPSVARPASRLSLHSLAADASSTAGPTVIAVRPSSTTSSAPASGPPTRSTSVDNIFAMLRPRSSAEIAQPIVEQEHHEAGSRLCMCVCVCVCVRVCVCLCACVRVCVCIHQISAFFSARFSLLLHSHSHTHSGGCIWQARRLRQERLRESCRDPDISPPFERTTRRGGGG